MSRSHDHAAEVNAGIIDSLRAENTRLQVRVGELEIALWSLESVTRSYLRYPLEGEGPGYDAKDVLAYCDEALTVLGEEV